MSEQKRIEKPTVEEEKELDSLLNSEVSYVEVRGKKWKSAPLYPGTIRKMTNVVLKEEAEDKVSIKCAALFRLNDLLLITLFYGILWRWWYYVKEYRNAELLPYIAECKKKMGLEAYILCTISLTAMKDTAMAMTRKEVQLIQAEHAGEAHGHSQKNIPE